MWEVIYSALLTQRRVKFDCLNRVVKHHLKRLPTPAPKAPRSLRGPVSDLSVSCGCLDTSAVDLLSSDNEIKHYVGQDQDKRQFNNSARDLRRWYVKLVRKVYLETLQNKNDDINVFK